MAYSNNSQLLMLAYRDEAAEAWARKAIDLARELGDAGSLSHALNNLGSALAHGGGFEAGRDHLEESLAVALAAELDEDIARAYVNLTWMAAGDFVYDDARRCVAAGMAHVDSRELEGFQAYLTATRSKVRFETGEWDEAEEDARWVMSRPSQAGISPVPAMAALGTIQVRRGRPEAEATLLAAWELAVASAELQRTAPVAFGVAELAWWREDPSLAEPFLTPVYQQMQEFGSRPGVGEAAIWMWRLGMIADAPPTAADPFAMEIAGDWRGAADEWRDLGRPYEQALALATAHQESELLEALTIFDELGAVPAAARVRRTLRDMGAVRVPRRARPATRANPAGLTSRQLEVLALLAEGLTNAQIADRLFVSPKTVDHHVSAVLMKLAVTSRNDVKRAADRLGICAS